MAILGSTPIKIVQGEYRRIPFKFRNIKIFDTVDRIRITSDRLLLDRILEKDTADKKFYLEIFPEDTITAIPSKDTFEKYTYDIEIVFYGDRPMIQSGIALEILERQNPGVV